MHNVCKALYSNSSFNAEARSLQLSDIPIRIREDIKRYDLEEKGETGLLTKSNKPFWVAYQPWNYNRLGTSADVSGCFVLNGVLCINGLSAEGQTCTLRPMIMLPDTTTTNDIPIL